MEARLLPNCGWVVDCGFSVISGLLRDANGRVGCPEAPSRDRFWTLKTTPDSSDGVSVEETPGSPTGLINTRNSYISGCTWLSGQ